MIPTSYFAATGPAVLSGVVAGGWAATANPAAGTSATALLLSAPTAAVTVRFAATSTAPNSTSADFADATINAGGLLVITAPNQISAPLILSAGGLLSATLGIISNEDLYI